MITKKKGGNFVFFFFDWTFIILIPGMIIAAWAQGRVTHNYHKYSRVQSSAGYTGAEMARILLNYNGLTNVAVERVRGTLSDHYDPSKKVLRLSEGIYDSTSIAALAVAAHECGHAIQDKESYAPLRIRGALVPVANFASYASWILLLIGIFMGALNIAQLGVFIFLAVVLFQLITLPVEFNASSRALVALETGGFLTESEVPGAKKVLSAAAMTYVAALITAILSMIRLIFLALSANRE